MIPLVLALTSLAPLAQELDLNAILRELTPEERFARRVTPEHLVALKARPAVVFIETDVQVAQRDIFGRLIGSRTVPYGSGSGAVIRPEGFIVTNYHVVANAQKITVHFDKSLDEVPYTADLVSFVAEEDLALLKIESPGGEPFPTLDLGTSSDLMVGERVVAIGNPYGHTHTVSAGIISGLHRDIPIQDPNQNRMLRFDDLIQTDASINIGNSGGPLLNINGELIGINNAVNPRAENIGFAIPVDRVREVLQQQLISPDSYRAWLGFHVEQGDDRLEVREVFLGGPAATAGLRVGDRVVGLERQSLSEHGQYLLARMAISPVDIVEVRVLRPGSTAEHLLRLKPWGKVDGLIYEHMGVRLHRSVRGDRGYLHVAEVAPDGPAREIGMQQGDRIEMVRPKQEGGRGGRRLQRRGELATILAQLEPRSPLEVYIRREGRSHFGLLVTR